MNTHPRKLIAAVSLCAGLLSTTLVNAAPVSITITGTVTHATGTLASELGHTITASFLFDLDGSAATHIDTDSSDNPLETFTAIYSFGSGAYGWSASSSSGGSASGTYTSIQTLNDIADAGFNAGNPFDTIDIWGSNDTPICPQAVIDVKGYCDETDLNPGTGFELGLSMGMPDNWFNGTNLPGYIPSLNALLGSWAWAYEYDAGLTVGTFDATVTSMSVVPAAVPVPAAAWLFGSGLLGLIGASRKCRHC